MWHGRDLRQYRRLLSPPLEVLLTCPGAGGLGRGLASLPLAALAEAGLASGLSTLAEDAVAVRMRKNAAGCMWHADTHIRGKGCGQCGWLVPELSASQCLC